MIEDDAALLARQLLQIRHLDRAADVDPHRLEMIEEARQMQPRTAHLVHCHMDLVEIRGFIVKIQLELRNDVRERNGIDICDLFTPVFVVLLPYHVFPVFASVSWRGLSQKQEKKKTSLSACLFMCHRIRWRAQPCSNASILYRHTHGAEYRQRSP